MLSRLFTCLLIFTCVNTLIAQVGNDIDGFLLTQTDAFIDDLIDAGGQSSILQQGSGNSAEVVQIQRLDQGNEARIAQYGNDNAAQVKQDGWNNQVRLVQRGNENAYSLDLNGSNNDIATIQNGNQNEVRQRFDNARDVNVEFIQNGDANLIDYQADGLISKDILIRQNGSDMQVTINRTSTGGRQN